VLKQTEIDMLYSPQALPVNTISGRNVALAKRNAVERALLAADLCRGSTEFTGWTIAQAATIAKVCPAYVAAAIALGDDEDARARVLLGCRPLIMPPAKPTPEALAAQRRQTARQLGADLLWQTLVEPLLS
jgi:hypothetical protein